MKAKKVKSKKHVRSAVGAQKSLRAAGRGIRRATTNK